MMKNLEFRHVEPEALKKRQIQGLFAPESACQSFWTLKARVELSSFNEEQGEKVNE